MPHSHLQLTEACEDRDFFEWHQGCPWCAVWVLRVEDVAVQRLVDQVRASIARWLLPRYARQPHVTLAYRGLVDVEGDHVHAEFGVPQLQADIRALQVATLHPWQLRLQEVHSFSTVPYLGIAPAPALMQTHDALTAHAPYPGWSYVPHITLGHYGSVQTISAVMQKLQASLPSDAVLPELAINALWLARYRTEDIAGPLFFEGRFDLHTQRYHPEPDALLLW